VLDADTSSSEKQQKLGCFVNKKYFFVIFEMP
jgi:hypothetical protein